MSGPYFLVSALYLTLLVAFTMTLLEDGFQASTVRQTLRRYGKFLLLLVVLGIIVQGLTFAQGLFA